MIQKRKKGKIKNIFEWQSACFSRIDLHEVLKNKFKLKDTELKSEKKEKINQEEPEKLLEEVAEVILPICDRKSMLHAELLKYTFQLQKTTAKKIEKRGRKEKINLNESRKWRNLLIYYVKENGFLCL